jgi:hypothetical protein
VSHIRNVRALAFTAWLAGKGAKRLASGGDASVPVVAKAGDWNHRTCVFNDAAQGAIEIARQASAVDHRSRRRNAKQRSLDENWALCTMHTVANLD